MKKIFLTTVILLMGMGHLMAQAEDAGLKPLSMEEYELSKTFEVPDLDNDSYVKVGDGYVLDRYEMRKPYFITGDDGLRKRMDLFKLLDRESLEELGVMIFYTSEKGEKYKATLPNFTAAGEVWAQYFEDIHAIDKKEENFVLKLSYILSKEMSFQMYKALNSGEDMQLESATYGNDICFPGNQLVAMANGGNKFLKDVAPGDRVITIDPETRQEKVTEIKELVSHEAKNYAITQLLVAEATETISDAGVNIRISNKLIEATPNHPMMTRSGKKKIGEIAEGEEILCQNKAGDSYESYTVLNKKDYAAGTQKVYNMVANEGTTFVMNGVMVLQK